MSNQLQGKVILITGGGSGIGQATAIACAHAGASIVLCGRNTDRLRETLEFVRRISSQAVAIQTDVSHADDVQEAIAEGTRTFGGVDCAFNNAGILGTLAPLTELNEQDFDDVMAVNVKGVWLSMKYEIEEMLRRGGGTIVNNASLSGILATPGGSFYNASKHAVLGLTKCAAVEYIRSGIRVNAVCPGSFPTAMLDQFMAFGTTNGEELKARQNSFVSGIPAGRFGKLSEIADVVVWLLSDASSFVVGQAITVDGGTVIM